jgi:hypothetical protein
MSNQTCPTQKHMSPKNRRTFIKDSLTKSLVAANAAVLAGLISAPGVVQAGGGTTTTAPITDPSLWSGTKLTSGTLEIWAGSPQECRELAWAEMGNQVIIERLPAPSSVLSPREYTGGTVVLVSPGSYKITIPSGGTMTMRERVPGV